LGDAKEKAVRHFTSVSCILRTLVFDQNAAIVRAFLLCTALSIVPACGSGSKSGATDNTAPPTSEKLKTVLKSAQILPTAGGLISTKSANPAQNGASLSVPAHAVASVETVSMGVEDLPGGSPPGQTPLGAVFGLIPSGLAFAEPASLGLPIPAGVDKDQLYIGVFNSATNHWDNLGGVIDGDYISTKIKHLSTYGVFAGGKSTVNILNGTADTGAGNVLTYIGGPAPPPGTQDGAAFPANPPPFAPGTQFNFKAGETKVFELAPGQYNFIFSYPSPQPGVANNLSFVIPPLTQGADDGQVDQTLTIGDNGATSDNATTQGSIVFAGRSIVAGTNTRPVINCTVSAPAGVAVTSGEASGTLPSRIVNVGPIKVEEFKNGAKPLTFTGTPSDPEGSQLTVFWTQYQASVGKSIISTAAAASGTPFNSQNFTPSVGGTYTVYATIYDNFGLFDECHWNITVVPNTPPTLRVVVDDVVIDFGRLDAAPSIPGPGSPDRRVAGVGPDIFGATATAATSLAAAPGFPVSWPSGFAVGATGPGGQTSFFNAAGPIGFPAPAVPWSNLCGYVDTNGDGTGDTTVLKLLSAIEGDLTGLAPFFASFEPHIRPLQYPDGMTCVFALYTDADGDPVGHGGFVLPIPVFGEGTVYMAISIPAGAPFLLPDGTTVGSQIPSGLPVGTAIDNQLKMDAYNATVTAAANAGLLNCQFSTTGALTIPLGTPGPCIALPIIFEAPDDPDPALQVHDCRHLVDCTHENPRGGTINVEARVTDGFSPEQKDFGLIAYPDVESVFPNGLTLNITPNPADPGPGQTVIVTACVVPARADVVISFDIVGTDGFTKTESPATNGEGCADFSIPGGAENVVDVVTVTVGKQPSVLNPVTSSVTYTF
jgi:hypothetical protein